MRGRDPRAVRRLPPRAACRLALLAAALSALALSAASPALADTASRGPLVPRAPLLAITSAASSFSLAPVDIRAAYSLPKTGPSHQTIAIVSAYDDPAAESDLSAYTRKFGIPACTTMNRCFRKLGEAGHATPLPPPDPTGGTFVTESALGTQVARGVCQSCSIVLVEASSPSKADLSAAVASAARAGAEIIVTAFTAGEEGDDSQYAANYSHPGSVVVAATGDGGYTGSATFPSAMPGVIAVGGTSLDLTESDIYHGEAAWPRATSACSIFSPAPVWQAKSAAAVGCAGKRAVADISAVADPGALVHVQNAGVPGGPWYAGGGTSLAAPLVAGVIGLGGGAGSSEAQRLYERAASEPGALHDVSSGQTEGCTASRPICAARHGFDGPTGLGTPYGLAAFDARGGVIGHRYPAVTATSPRHRIQVSSGSIAHLAFKNANKFAVTAAVTLRSTQPLSFGGRRQRITFATTQLTLDPLGSATTSLSIPSRYRGLLKQLGHTRVRADITLRGLSGPSTSETGHFGLYAP
ncbi:MAG: S8 family serine peptidase [Solirubrobacteraceae bacterium]